MFASVQQWPGNGRSLGKDMNWVSPTHAVSTTPSRSAVNVRRGNKAPPRIVAQCMAGTHKVNVLDLINIVSGPRQTISPKYNDFGQTRRIN